MSDSFLQREPLEELAELFIEELRRGQQPSVSDYARRHPDLAERIRRLFPKLLMMEKVAPGDHDVVPSTPCDIDLNTQLGDFLVLREVGRGGMGIVYEALQQSLGRRVAVKVLMNNSLTLDRRRQRFQREARAAARLHHTNIVPVYGVGQHEQACFYVMQLIDGQGLHDVLHALRSSTGGDSSDGALPTGATAAARLDSRTGDTDVTLVARSLVDGPLPLKGSTDPSGAHAEDRSAGHAQTFSGRGSNQHYWKSVASVGIQIADALEYAHAHGTFHRDIKPANILLDCRGTVWVTDFGLAKVADEDDLTRDGDVVGTVRYMAPEQFDAKCDQRSDIYSLGLTLYELLTLRPAGDEPQLATRRLTVAVRPRKINSEIPADLETIVLKASAWEPDQRYQSAGQLADDLRCFLSDRPIKARRVSVLEHGWRWCRRNPLVAGLGAAVALLLMIVVATSVTLAFRFQSEKELAIENFRLAEENSLRALEVAFATARSTGTENRPGHRLESWNAAAWAAELLADAPLPLEQKSGIRRRLRDDAIAALTTVDVELAEDWSYDAPPLGLIRAGFDSRIDRYALQEESGRVVVRRLIDNATVHRLGHFDREEELRVYVRFSPDDRLLAARGPVEGELRVHVWDLAKETLILDTGAGGLSYHTSFDFAPDSHAIAVYGDRGRVEIHDLAAGGSVTERIATRRIPYFVRFDPNGRRLALGVGQGDGTEGEIDIVDLDQPDSAVRLIHPNFVSDAAWSPDGRWLATPCYDYKVRVWNASTGVVHSVCEGHRGKPRHVAYHPLGHLLMSTAWDSSTRFWNPQTGQELLRCTDRGVAFSRDGRWLGSEQPASVGVRRWRVANSDACRTLYGHDRNAYVLYLSFSPDGSLLASASDRDGVRLWNVRRGRELSHLVQEYSAGVAFADEPLRLFTSSRSGLRSWPMTVTQTTAKPSWRCGPPELLDGSHPRQLSTGGNVLLVASTDSWATLHREATTQPLGPLNGPTSGNTKFVAVSPDGRWAATSGKRAANVTIWDLQTRKSVHELAVGPARVAFSPDGGQLVTSVFQQYIFWEVGSWRERRRLSHDGPGYGCVAFSPDMQLMATTASHRVIISDPSTETELATLAAPNPELLSTAHPEGTAALCFSRDGALLAVGAQGGKIRLWDLPSIRRELAAVNLDWSRTPITSNMPGDDGSMTIDVIEPEQE